MRYENRYLGPEEEPWRMKDEEQLPGSHQEPVKTFEGHDNTIYSIETFTDGKRIATGSFDKTIRIWRLEDGTEMMKWVVEQWVGALAILGNGKWIASAEGEDPRRDPEDYFHEDDFDKVAHWQLWVRDVESGSIVAGPLEGHTNVVLTLDISPDGETLASGSYDRTVILWDTTTWQRKGHPRPLACGSPIACIRFSPTGQLGVATREDIQIWDLERRERFAQFEGHRSFNNASNFSLTWTHDGTHLFSAGNYNDPVIRCWETSTWKQAGDPWTGHDEHEHISHIILNPAGTLLASASGDHTVRLWQFPIGTEVARFEHSDDVYYLAFSVDGRSVFSGGWDKKMSQWEIPEDVLAAAESVSLASVKSKAGRAKHKMKGLHNSYIHRQRRNMPVNYQRATSSASPRAHAEHPSPSRSLDLRTFFNGMRPSFDKKGKQKEYQSKQKTPRVVNVPLGEVTYGDVVGVDDGKRPYVLFFCLSWFQKKEKKPVPRPVYDDDPSDDESEHSIANVPIPTTRTQFDAPKKVKLNPGTFFQSQPEAGPSRLAPPVDNEQVETMNVSMPTPRVQIAQREDIELKPMTSQSQPEAGPSRLAAPEEHPGA